MIINHINICNFGIYRGENYYDFSLSSGKNIILINGKNGSGKTTLLNAFKIGLYGSFFLGYKTQHKEYTDYISSRLNAFSVSEGDRKCYISISFSIIESGITQTYSITRDWDIDESMRVEENLIVRKNNHRLSTTDSYEFADRIAEMISPDYIDLFFFDGEKIDQLLAKSKSQEYIMEIFSKLFNLDLFQTLKTDLSTHKKKLLESNKQSQIEVLYEDKLAEMKSISDSLMDLEQQSEKAKSKRNALIEELKQVEKSFKELGGLNSIEKQNTQLAIQKLYLNREKLRAKQRETISEYLPFMILTKELNELKRTITQERIDNDLRIFWDKLNTPSLIFNLEERLNHNKETMYSIISEQFPEPTIGTRVLDLSYSEEAEVLHLIHDIGKNNINKILKDFETDKQLTQEIEISNKRLHEGMTESVDLYATKMGRLNTEVGVCDHTIDTAAIELGTLFEAKGRIQAEIDKLYKEIKSTRKDENSYTLINKLDSVIDEYVAVTRRSKLERLETVVTEIFRSLIRKEDFIREIRIDPLSEQFKIYNRLGNEVPEANLSAGERQIFILSILWGLLKISNRQIPIVFDTLLGRLDKTHKERIINHFLHQLGEQIIILATDTEVDEEYQKLLKPHLAKHYFVDYHDQDEKVYIKEQTS